MRDTVQVGLGRPAERVRKNRLDGEEVVIRVD
jgi:hypothetical protein